MVPSFEETIGRENETSVPGSDQLDSPSVLSWNATSGNFENCPPSRPIPASPGLTIPRAAIGDSSNTGPFYPDNNSTGASMLQLNSNINYNSDGEVHIPIPETSMFMDTNSNSNNNGDVHIQIRGGESVMKELFFDRRKVTKIFIVIVAQIALTLNTNGSFDSTDSSSFLSPISKILQKFSKACNLTAFICFLYGILVFDRRNPGGIARIFTGIGVFATTYGILAFMCQELVERQELQLLITAAAFIACIPIIVAGFLT